MQDFKNKTAVLTGAGSGFGLECARIGARLGMNLVLVDVQQDALDRAASEMQTAGAAVLARRVDVSRSADMELLGAEVLARFGAPHLVFNNAGVGAGGLIWETGTRDWEWVLGVNLRGGYLCARETIQHLLAQNRPGSIINVSSVHEIIPRPNYLSYSLSKGA